LLGNGSHRKGPFGLRIPRFNFLEWITGQPKSLSQMSRSELRRQEIMLDKDRTQLLNRITRLGREKQELFERGLVEHAPEVRRTLAQEFELKTTEQLMLGRQLNIRSKEMLTVSRLRMLRESADRAGQSNRLGLISESDIVRLGKLIESDAVKAEVYMERLDEILSMGARVDEGSASMGESGKAVLDVWERMDAGAISDKTAGFEEADRSVRERQAAPEA
jgi:hypothetical protein